MNKTRWRKCYRLVTSITRTLEFDVNNFRQAACLGEYFCEDTDRDIVNCMRNIFANLQDVQQICQDKKELLQQIAYQEETEHASKDHTLA